MSITYSISRPKYVEAEKKWYVDFTEKRAGLQLRKNTIELKKILPMITAVFGTLPPEYRGN